VIIKLWGTVFQGQQQFYFSSNQPTTAPFAGSKLVEISVDIPDALCKIVPDVKIVETVDVKEVVDNGYQQPDQG
jgi:hypothetical protein